MIIWVTVIIARPLTKTNMGRNYIDKVVMFLVHLAVFFACVKESQSHIAPLLSSRKFPHISPTMTYTFAVITIAAIQEWLLKSMNTKFQDSSAEQVTPT